MTNEPRTFELAIEYKGKTHNAWYSIDKRVITVYAKRGKKPTQVDGLPPMNVAPRLLFEIIEARGRTAS